MAQRLNASYIAQIYTLEQIDAKIVTLETALMGSAQGGYTFDSGQHKQTITSADPASIEALLAVYIKARMIKTRDYKGTQLVSVNYTP